MAYNVVCISATDGAMGEEIGPRVAEGLGFRLVNEQIVREAADAAGVQAVTMADVEQRRSLLDRVIHQLLASASAGDAYGYSPMPVVDTGPTAEDLRGVIRGVIEDFGARGSAVIVSHAASHALAGRGDTLRVLITAEPASRAERVKAAHKLSDGEAQKRIARGDANRADYIKRFYGVSPELPTHYDIVINSERMAVDQAVDLIVRAASTGLAGPPPD